MGVWLLSGELSTTEDISPQTRIPSLMLMMIFQTFYHLMSPLHLYVEPESRTMSACHLQTKVQYVQVYILRHIRQAGSMRHVSE